MEEVGAGAVNAEGLGHFADAANQEFHFLLGIEEMERGANTFRVIHLAHHDLVVLPQTFNDRHGCLALDRESDQPRRIAPLGGR